MRIPAHERLFVLVAAMADKPGLRDFYVYNSADGQSSSLNQANATRREDWHDKPADFPSRMIVSAITLSNLLDAIPLSLHIAFLKTDLQGWDSVVLRSAGRQIERIAQIQAEVFQPHYRPYRDGPDNTFPELDSFFREHGFAYSVSRSNNVSPDYVDAVWVRH